jgi:hypothetical protein
MHRRTFLAALGFALLPGCGSDGVILLHDDPEQLILYSIDGPAEWKQDGELTPEQKKGEVLHGYPVLGKVEITEPKQRRELLSAMKRAVGNDNPANCFIPRHAIRSIKGGETVDVVICFECGNYRAYRQGERAYGGTPGVKPSAQPRFDKILRDAGVPLASPAKN